MTWRLELELDTETHTIEGDDFINTPSWRAEPSAITTWEATVPWSPNLEDWTRAEARIYFGDELLLRGEFNNIESADTTSNSRLVGDDIIKDLERGGASVTFNSIEVHEAIRQYAEEYLDEWTVTVYEPDVTTVDDGLLVQDWDTTTDFEDGFGDSIGDTDPITIKNGELKLLQTGWTIEAEDANSENSQIFEEDPDAYSGGDGLRLGRANEDYCEFIFTPGYTIPEGELEAYVRMDVTHEDVCEGRWYLEDSDGGRIAETGSQSVGIYGLEWQQADIWANGWTPPELKANETYTIGFETTTDETPDYLFDVVAFFDSRYEYNFDNDVHEPGGYLNGPELYPSSVQVTAEEFGQSWNISAAEIDVSVDDTGGEFALAASNDKGDTFVSESNTSSARLEFDTVGTTIRGRVTLSRYGDRDTATPRTGYNSQTVDSWTLRIDTNDLAVIDNREYTGSHFENFQRLHEGANMVFVPDYLENGYALESFVPGEVEESGDWTRKDHTRRVDVSDYANTIRVFGAEDAETGERLEVTATSQSEVDRVGEEIPGTPVFRDKIDSREQLKSIARSELSELVAEDRLSGTVEIVPKPLQPGKSYVVPILDEKTLPLWSVEFDDSRGGNGSLEFGQLDDLASAFASIRSEIRNTKG